MGGTVGGAVGGEISTLTSKQSKCKDLEAKRYGGEDIPGEAVEETGNARQFLI